MRMVVEGNVQVRKLLMSQRGWPAEEDCIVFSIILMSELIFLLAMSP